MRKVAYLKLSTSDTESLVSEPEIEEKPDLSIDLEKNILISLSHGYKTNIAYKRNNSYYYNDMKCDTKNWINLNSDLQTVFFRTNMMHNNALKINIISPFME